MKYYFSRRPGEFVNETTGKSIEAPFTGTVREWYEMLAYFVARCAKKEFKNEEIFEATVSPDVMTMLECTIVFRPILDDYKYCNNGIVNNRYQASLSREQQRNLISVTQNDKKFEIEIKHMDII